MNGPQPFSRHELLARAARSGRWDVIVVGGGASGLGCAVDSVARGFSTLLIEGRDFAAGTSSRSTKLIHGGVRYLGQGRIHLVREALVERARLLANAPHTVQARRFVVPCRSRVEQLYFAAGLKAYDLLAGAQGIGHTEWLDGAATLQALPNLSSGFCGGIAYMDGQFDDAALAFSLLRTFLSMGGVALNYCPVRGFAHDGGKIAGVLAEDAETGTPLSFAGKAVINATGVWGDQLRRFDDPGARPMLQPSQGIHLVLDGRFIGGDTALLIPKTPDGRLLFAIPWQGKTLLGTTDTPVDAVSDEPCPLDAEIDFVLETAGRYLAVAPRRSDILSTFAGLRPLVREAGGVVAHVSSQLSREHVIEIAPSGLLTLAGGKWTTYRKMAEDALDRLIDHAGLPYRRVQTAGLSLLPPSVSGLQAGDSAQPLSPAFDLTAAQVRHAVRNDLARNVEDLMARRHRALFLDARQALAVAPAVARIMAEELGCGEDWIGAQMMRFGALVQQFSGGLTRNQSSD